jgi:hypothetical protein
MRCDIACAAYLSTLIVTMQATGEYSLKLLAARGWETIVGGVIGPPEAMLIVPLRALLL